MNKSSISVLFLLFSFYFVQAQVTKHVISINTTEILHSLNNYDALKEIYYSDAILMENNFSEYTVNISSVNYNPISYEQIKHLNDLNQLSTSISIDHRLSVEQKKTYLRYLICPFRINPITNEYEIAQNLTLEIKTQPSKKSVLSHKKYKGKSLLASGNWYKIKIINSGVYKLTHDQIVEIGLNNPQNIRVYGYGGKQLPYANSSSNYDDLNELPIKMETGSDGVFNSGDYILFYSSGTLTWNYNSSLKMFVNESHLFSNYIYLFITSDLGAGQRIETIDNSNLPADYSTNSFDSYQCHELDKYNLIKSGRTWYGEKFKPQEQIDFEFNFPNLIQTEEIRLRTNIAGRKDKTTTASFKIKLNSTSLGSISIDASYGDYTYAHSYTKDFFFKSDNPNFKLNVSFSSGNASSEGYLNYLCLNAREKLVFSNYQFSFRDIKTLNNKTVCKYSIENAENNTVWDITDPQIPIEVKTSLDDNTLSFKTKSDTLREFVTFTTNTLLEPIILADDLGKVANQNLHGIDFHDMLIVTHPNFLTYAETLAELHRTNDDLSVYVTTPQLIYNEFSSGTPDVTAIRNFVRMLYDRSSNVDEMPKYLLLFGDGSYDNRSTSNNTNFIPTYQSENALSETASFVSDDFFGILDPGEGGSIGSLDIGIGRFPVQNAEQANLMIDKINRYLSHESKGDWRTQICFIGDDEDSNTHMSQPDKIAKNLKTTHPEFNVNKIYIDAYEQVSTAAGERYPDVTAVINAQVDQGALIIDYVGHGNPRILTHEQVLSSNDVKSWTNYNKLPIFVTASCEVGRFDDYEITSFGEWILLNPNGGGIAALTTTRVVYSGGNDILNKNFFNTVFDKDLRLGDIIRIAKVKTGGDNQRNFSLLGDPALKLAVPENKTYISQINDNIVTDNSSEETQSSLNSNNNIRIEYIIDTLSALEKASIKGYILDQNDDLIVENGELYVTIFDKAKSLSTLGNDYNPFNFELQNSILFKGKASITEGFFDFECIIPKDINYALGNGKISLYAALETMDAIGYSDRIIIGGNNTNAEIDNNGPEIELFMNDTLFVNGGSTHQDPILIAHLVDENGINTTGNGFGHNITAILDGDQNNIYVLNNFFTGDIDKYNQGKIRFPFYNLSPGEHILEVKAWDIYNNSSSKSIAFTVYEEGKVVIENLKNSPNPFNEKTHFIFEHNQSGNKVTITLNIFDVMGNKVAELQETGTLSGFQKNSLVWNGVGNNGAKLSNGIYLYTMEMMLENGEKTTKSSKLMIFR